ncbi:hypothetical protein [Sinomonas sp. ASV322]|uniref:O-antigen ligase family protein n=1 Tax=Sinomonas sp. ASV322 TaxID=3041920 RepID=UPI0027DACD6F|nr:hypothetical protein [Sinomonas sp. ASV322]MDQ4502982.1 hypothetical protein [Sinomonas sp. ASV322]
MIVLGEATISPFYFGLILYSICSFTAWRRGPGAQSSGFRGRVVLVILLVYCTFVTAISPALFAGLGVISATNGIDEQVRSLTPLTFTLSNFAQIAYLLLNVMFVWRSQRDGTFEGRHIAIGLAIGAIVACSSFMGDVWPHALFDNSPRGFYTIETGRFRGQFSEPSHLGAFAVIATIYFGATLARTKTVRGFVGYAVLTFMAVALLYASASGTAAIGLGAAVLAMLAISLRGRRFGGSTRVRLPVFLGGLVAVVMLTVLLPSIIDVIKAIVDSKLGSTSLTNRSLVDQNSIAVLFRTFLLGAGDGSNRGSSLLLMLLSQIGLIGTALFLVVALTSIFRGLSSRANAPAALALIGFLSSAFVSLPDFASPILWSLIAVTYSTAFVRQEGGAALGAVPRGVVDERVKSTGSALESEFATVTGYGTR